MVGRGGEGMAWLPSKGLACVPCKRSSGHSLLPRMCRTKFMATIRDACSLCLTHPLTTIALLRLAGPGEKGAKTRFGQAPTFKSYMEVSPIRAKRPCTASPVEVYSSNFIIGPTTEHVPTQTFVTCADSVTVSISMARWYSSSSLPVAS